MKCPECNRIHRKQKTAQPCMAEAARELTHYIIAHAARDFQENEELAGKRAAAEIRNSIMEEYFTALPF